MSFSHSNPDIITKSSLVSKVISNFGHRDMRHIKEELSEGTMTLSDTSNFCTSGYEETHRVAKHFREFRQFLKLKFLFFQNLQQKTVPDTKIPPIPKTIPVYHEL